jgi:hypothetical protein
MARSPIAAVMVGKTIGRTIDEHQIPVYVERFGDTRDEIFVTAPELRRLLGDDEFERLPTGAIGLYTYYERLAQGLRQLMCGSRKFDLSHIGRDDIAALTPEAARVSGIPYIMDVDRADVQEILNGCPPQDSRIRTASGREPGLSIPQPHQQRYDHDGEYGKWS